MGGILLVRRLVRLGFVDDCQGRYRDTLAGWLKTVLIGTVVDDTYFSAIIDVSVFADYLSSGELGLYFETAVSAFEAVGV